MSGTMKVSTRLALAFGLVIVLMFGLGAVSASSLMTLNRQVDNLANSSTPQIQPTEPALPDASETNEMTMPATAITPKRSHCAFFTSA